MEGSLLEWLLTPPTEQELTCSCGHVARDYAALSAHKREEAS